jgi:uncharacterized membrane protein
MATLTVWRFDTAEGADHALEELQRAHRQQMLDLIDGAVVSFPQGSKKPKTRQLHTTMGTAALSGAFWGLLFGLIFFVPLLGVALGASMGALTVTLTDFGIDEAFIKQVRQSVTPGTSALFLYTQNVQQGLLDELKASSHHAVLIQSNLSEEQEARLRETFGEEPPSVAA